MLRKLCKSKIHGAAVTEANLGYSGSIVIDEGLMNRADMLPNEMVLVANINTGARFETYVIAGKRDSGVIGLQGAAARLGKVGDRLIIFSYIFLEEKEAAAHKMKAVFVDEKNKPIG